MVELLKQLSKINQTESEHVFLSKQQKPLSSIRTPFENAVKKVGIKDFRFHDLRHTFASHYVMSGGDNNFFKTLKFFNKKDKRNLFVFYL